MSTDKLIAEHLIKSIKNNPEKALKTIMKTIQKEKQKEKENHINGVNILKET